MGQINTTNLPQYVSEPRLTAAKLKTVSATYGSLPSSETSQPQDDWQFTNLSGTLNSFKNGALAIRGEAAQVMTSVRGGTYDVDPMQVSRSIVGESLASH